MGFFEGCDCVLCRKTLKDGDDVVACPVCGAPHHRSCYKENGGCGCEESHGEGFSWKRQETGAHDEAAAEDVRCGVCGCANPSGRLYCQGCGRPLGVDPARDSSDFSDPRFARQNDPASDSMMIEDVPMSDIKRFLGGSAIIYAPIFYRLYTLGKKVAFNILALIFPALWFVGRKMYTFGGALFAAELLILALQARFFEYFKRLTEVTMNFDTSGTLALMQEQPALTCLFMLISLGTYAVHILSGIFGNRIYMGWSLKRIRTLKAAAKNTDEYNIALEANGRGTIVVPIIFIGVFFILSKLIERLLLG